MRFALRTIAAWAMIVAVAVPQLGAQPRLQWESISGGMTEGIAGIHMLNGTYIAAGMNPGGVFLTNDKGMTWAAANEGLDDTRLTSLVYDHQSKILYAATESGKLFQSADLAQHWDFHSLLPVGTEKLVAQLEALFAYGPGGNAYYYDNGWMPLHSKQSEDHSATMLACLPNEMVFIGTKAKGLYRSTDEGMTWDNVWPNSAQVHALYTDPYTSVLYLATDAGMRRSLDYGETWEAFPLPDSRNRVLDFYAFDAVSALAIDPVTKQIYATGDAGATWIPYPESPEFETLFFTGNGYFIGAGTTSGVSMTSDWGATWYTTMHSMKAKEIPSVQSYGPVPGTLKLFMGGQYVSTDGGMLWTRHPDLGMTDWRDTAVFQTMQVRHAGAWFLSAGADMYISDDMGESWMPMYSLGTEFITGFAFQQNTARDFVIITDAQILYYYDSQQMVANGWNSPVVNPGLVFVTSGGNVIVGDADTRALYFSPNRGETFEMLPGISYADRQKIFEYEPGVLLLGKYISSDGGATWTERRLNAETAVPEIYTLMKDLRGITYYGTADGVYVAWGLSDDLRYEGLNAPVTVLERLPDGAIAASGPGLGILRAEAEVLTGVDPVEHPVRTNVLTSAPNPFVSATAVTFTLERPGDITLAVYNLLGERIAAIGAGYSAQGSHTLQWNGRSDSGAEIPPGVYMLTLTTPSGISVQQLVKM